MERIISTSMFLLASMKPATSKSSFSPSICLLMAISMYNFGDIKDEHDLREYVAKKINDNEFVLSGRLEVEKVNEQFGLDLPESDQYETIAGLILEHCGHFPKVNEVIRVRKFTFKCVKMADNRIELVKLFC